MSQIRQGKVKMRPRSYFVALFGLAIITTILTATILSYITSIIFFWWRIQTLDTPARGARASLAQTIDSFPWWALILAIVMLIITVWLVKKQGTMYRHKTSVIVLIIISVSLALGLILSNFGIGNQYQPNHQFGQHRTWRQNR